MFGLIINNIKPNSAELFQKSNNGTKGVLPLLVLFHPHAALILFASL